jgi:hypothetical protein
MKKKTKRKMKAVKYVTVAIYKEHEIKISKLMRTYKISRCEAIRQRIVGLI